MSNFEEQMRLFEAEVGGAAAARLSGQPGARPAFLPHSVRANQFGGDMGPRGAQVPPPPTYPRPAQIHPTTARPGVLPLSKNVAPLQKEYSAAPVISKKKDDEDILSTLMKYEKEVKEEKKGVKRSRDQDSSANTTQPEKLMKPSHLSAKPTKAPVVKPGTQVTPDEIKLKAKQMVEMVKASQVIQTKRLPNPNTANSLAKPPETGGRGKKPKKMIRMAGGQMWEDSSLQEWDPNDFRIFCGDLGNDVTDEVLTRTFSRYSSFVKAKVVRDKRSNKTKGYGFVSFKDPSDFTKAIKEMDGKYVGSRPIKLRKSNWKDRNIDQVKQKQKIKNSMGYKF